MTLSRGAIELLKVLRSFGARIFPLQSTLAKRLRCTVRTVQRWLAELVQAGRVTVQQRGRTSASYRMVYQQVAEENVVPGFPQQQVDNLENQFENLWSDVENVVAKAPRSLLLNFRDISQTVAEAPATVFFQDPKPLRKPPDRERVLVRAAGASP